MRTRDLWWVVAALSLAACGEKAPEGPPLPKQAPHAHEKGPHGQELLVIGDEAAHVEVVHEEAAGTMTFYFLGADGKTALAVAAPALNFVAKEGPVQLALVAVGPGADGTSATWKGEHAALRGEPSEARLRVSHGGKTYQVELEHAH